MNKCIIDEGKFLKLNNVISFEIEVKDVLDISSKFKEVYLILKNNSIDIYGPIILKMQGKSQNQFNVMVQCRNKKIDLSKFEYYESLTSNSSLFTHYTGKVEDLIYVNMKMKVYAYEHDLIVKDELILVILDMKENIITADVFNEIKSI